MSYLSYSDKEKLISYITNKLNYYFPFGKLHSNTTDFEWINISLYHLSTVLIVDEDESTCLYLSDDTFEESIAEIFDNKYDSFVSKFEEIF